MSWVEIPPLGNIQSWDDATKDRRSVGEVSDALSFFRAVLGDSWRGWAARFPLAGRFFVALQDGPPEGVRLYRMMQRLDGITNLDLLIRKDLGAGTWGEYAAAVMALEFCSQVRAASAEIEVVKTTREKSPDVRVRMADRWITTELKALHDHEGMLPWDDWFKTVSGGLWARGLSPDRFDVDLEEEALAEPEAVVDGLAIVAAAEHREYQPLPRGIGRARLAAINCGKWGYPVYQRDELSRIVANLKGKWWQQLKTASDRSEPTLLVVRANSLLGSRKPAEVVTVATGIADAVLPVLAGKAMVGAILVYEEPFWAPVQAPVVDAGGVRVSLSRSAIGTARFSVLVANPRARVPLRARELDGLFAP